MSVPNKAGSITKRQDTAEQVPQVTAPTIEVMTKDLTIKVEDDPLSEVTSTCLEVSRDEEEGIVEDADFPFAAADEVAMTSESAADNADGPRNDLPQEIFGHILAWGKTVPFLDSLVGITEDIIDKTPKEGPKEGTDSSFANITLGLTDAETPPTKSAVIQEAFSFETCLSTDSDDSGTEGKAVKVLFHEDSPARTSVKASKRPSLHANVKRASSRTLTNDQITSTRNVLKAVDQSGDEELDPYELQSLFISQGILVPLDVVTTVFNEIDHDGNGLLTVEEFASFLHKSKFHQRVDFCKRMWFKIDWWCIMLWLVGGFLFLIGCFYVECELSSTSVFIY